MQENASRIPKPRLKSAGLTQRVVSFVSRIPSHSNTRRWSRMQVEEQSQASNNLTSEEDTSQTTMVHSERSTDNETVRSAACLQSEEPNWRVVISPECKELEFCFPNSEKSSALPKKIVITTETKNNAVESLDGEQSVVESAVVRAKENGRELTCRMSTAGRQQEVDPVQRSSSPEALSCAEGKSEIDWLNERASYALNELLRTLKIDPSLLRANPSALCTDEGTSLQASGMLSMRSPNEGKLKIHSHPLSTHSI